MRIDPDPLIADYLAGASIRQVAGRSGIGYGSAWRRLRAVGVLRPPGRQPRQQESAA